jgi:hypothetical protein
MQTRSNAVVCYFSDRELRHVRERADRELSDPALWIRRVAVSIAEGRARVVARERDLVNVDA